MLLGAVTTLRPNITPKWVLIPQPNMYLTLIWALIPRIVPDTHSILSSCIVHNKTMDAIISRTVTFQGTGALTIGTV